MDSRYFIKWIGKRWNWLSSLLLPLRDSLQMVSEVRKDKHCMLWVLWDDFFPGDERQQGIEASKRTKMVDKIDNVIKPLNEFIFRLVGKVGIWLHCWLIMNGVKFVPSCIASKDFVHAFKYFWTTRNDSHWFMDKEQVWVDGMAFNILKNQRVSYECERKVGVSPLQDVEAKSSRTPQSSSKIARIIR